MQGLYSEDIPLFPTKNQSVIVILIEHGGQQHHKPHPTVRFRVMEV